MKTELVNRIYYRTYIKMINAYSEQYTDLFRKKVLTYRGAARILKKQGISFECIEKIETFYWTS